jgi:TrpR family trp operon transcriptional repressor
MEYKHEYGVELEELIRKVSKDKNNAFLREFLFDLLSAAEYRDLAIRWQIIKMLNAKVPHRDISKKLKVGLATINRGVAELANKKGGFKMALNKYQKKSSV